MNIQIIIIRDIILGNLEENLSFCDSGQMSQSRFWNEIS